jgi:SAM-dependent methyltransferase
MPADQRVILRSFDEWSAYADEHPGVHQLESLNRVGERILREGFVEPMTGRRADPEIIERGSDWREGIGAFGLNARQRHVLKLIDEHTRDIFEPRIFGAEAFTPLAMLLRGRFARYYGAEYGATQELRDQLYPIPHEDLTALTLKPRTFDVVTTNEVLEHVPNVDGALYNLSRVLKAGGVHIGTLPFAFWQPKGFVRAKLHLGQVVHLMDQERHGNPADPDGGSLVFEIPGWDIIDRAKAAGFEDAYFIYETSEEHGFLNSFVFVARNPAFIDPLGRGPEHWAQAYQGLRR